LGTNNLTIQGCTILYGYYGIYSSATSPSYSANNRLLGNTFNEQYYYGLFQSRMRGLELKDNTVNSTRTGNASSYDICRYLQRSNHFRK
jgi:parallel beta-helix repeat protein